MIIKEIDANKDFPKFKIFKNLERNDYISLFKHSDLMIGKSSSGLIETPIFQSPVVNIGMRNYGMKTAENLINSPHKFKDMKKSIIKGSSDEFKQICQNVKIPCGDEKASERIIIFLEDLKINRNLLVKS